MSLIVDIARTRMSGRGIDLETGITGEIIEFWSRGTSQDDFFHDIISSIASRYTKRLNEIYDPYLCSSDDLPTPALHRPTNSLVVISDLYRRRRQEGYVNLWLLTQPSDPQRCLGRMRRP